MVMLVALLLMTLSSILLFTVLLFSLMLLFVLILMSLLLMCAFVVVCLMVWCCSFVDIVDVGDFVFDVDVGIIVLVVLGVIYVGGDVVACDVNVGVDVGADVDDVIDV